MADQTTLDPAASATFQPGTRPRQPIPGRTLQGAPGSPLAGISDPTDLGPPGPIPGLQAPSQAPQGDIRPPRMPSAQPVPALSVVTDSAEDIAEAIARARAIRARKVEFKLEVPIVIAGKVYETLFLRRPTWPEFEKALSNPAVQQKRITENVAMMAVVCGVQPAILNDPIDGLDLFDGMRLMDAVQDFFPQALRGKPQPTSVQSSVTSPSDGDGAQETSTS